MSKVLFTGLPNFVTYGKWNSTRYPFIILAIQSPDKSQIASLVTQVIPSLPDFNKFDLSRIYLIGEGKGAASCYEYLGSSATAAHSIAAMITTNPANPNLVGSQYQTIGTERIPIWNLVGSEDQWTQYSQDLTNLLNSQYYQQPIVRNQYVPYYTHFYTFELFDMYSLIGNYIDMYTWLLQYKSTSRPAIYPTLLKKYVTTSSNLKYSYFEYKPNLPSQQGQKIPVIIYFHGGDSDGNGSPIQLDRIIYGSLPSYLSNGQINSSTFPFLVLAPQCENKNTPFWDTAIPIFDDLVQRYSSLIDPQRLYVAGQGRGGLGVTYLYSTQARANLIAAAIIVRVYDYCNNTIATVMSQTPTSKLWFYTNSGDPYSWSNFTTSWIDCLQSKGTNPKTTIINNNSDDSIFTAFNPQNTDNLYTWYLNNPKQ
ncbi:hypothetical protein DLAC_06820 [Tieghemostelium lacteum]|uniref:Peptidase S9 prolyl oligopeptidase catalytic domain-containing protein n=1 Tax=Tieghemostelium lacteum TaxID=361077 RepID=A0A151ZDH4_TIELA|nr:hypothetical protein DLAC_06820 [Tieghemostelium lacteum]|eukprot:KYQ91997.1 hypothetical protein DLAC_06820 [Tieghemostelium lacteum]